ncbi:MAG: ribosome biogenesis GTPase YlqF [Oscillospiraceae bacterium]|nr:ribosome biogenesis GTPase YlqF [Oscillospiraceae bacterium]
MQNQSNGAKRGAAPQVPQVQWFPGHMARTRRQIKESLPLVDAVAELRDARAPESSRNPELDKLIGGKPRIVLLNKCDLADPGATACWLRRLRREGCFALAVDCRSGKGLQEFPAEVRKALAALLLAREARGMAGKSVRLMVVGIPNTGKSSFINRMAGRSRAEAADRPGVTRRSQWFAAGRIPDGKGGGITLELLDTPGVLWPKFDDPAVGDRLAFLGSVKEEILDGEALALRLLEILRDAYPARLRERYRLAEDEEALALWEPWRLLEQIARRRGMLISGGEADLARASSALMDDLRSGKLGKITFDACGAPSPRAAGGEAEGA